MDTSGPDYVTRDVPPPPEEAGLSFKTREETRLFRLPIDAAPLARFMLNGGL